MHNVVIEKPYSFYPPYHGRICPKLLQRTLPRRLRREHGIVEVQCHGIELLRQSLATGHGVLITPNYSRVTDPIVIGELGWQAGALPFVMASWHLFMQNRLQTFLLRRARAFSIYREGTDPTDAVLAAFAGSKRYLIGAVFHNLRSRSANRAVAYKSRCFPQSQGLIHILALLTIG